MTHFWKDCSWQFHSLNVQLRITNIHSKCSTATERTRCTVVKSAEIVQMVQSDERATHPLLHRAMQNKMEPFKSQLDMGWTFEMLEVVNSVFIPNADQERDREEPTNNDMLQLHLQLSSQLYGNKNKKFNRNYLILVVILTIVSSFQTINPYS